MKFEHGQKVSHTLSKTSYTFVSPVPGYPLYSVVMDNDGELFKLHNRVLKDYKPKVEVFDAQDIERRGSSLIRVPTTQFNVEVGDLIVGNCPPARAYRVIRMYEVDGGKEYPLTEEYTHWKLYEGDQ